MKITFHGAVNGVTGSCFELETKTHKLLVDCGMYQGERAFEYNGQFDFDPRKIDAVLLTHAHYDHCGRLPILAKQGFEGRIFCTPPTKPLSNIVLEDAQHLMVDNNYRMGTPILFGEVDVQKVDSQMSTVNYHTSFEVVPGVIATFFDAGHILGSAFIHLAIDAKHTKDNKQLNIVFSGDIGNKSVPILPDTEDLGSAQVIICESTYGDREHEPMAERNTKLKDMINKILGSGGTLLIPAFSIERTQELLYELDKMIDESSIPSRTIYLDSPLSIKATGIYQEFSNYLLFDRDIFTSPDKNFFNFPNLKLSLSSDASKEINYDSKPKIIIAGAGMLNGGRILHHLKRYISDRLSGLLIIGYQAEGTLGRQILDGAKNIQIHKDDYEVGARVEAIGAFSAHGDRVKLKEWFNTNTQKADKVFLVHGEQTAKESFKEYLSHEMQSDIILPKYSQSFEL